MPVFLSGFVQTANQDAGDSCSEAMVGLTGSATHVVAATTGTGCEFGHHPSSGGIALSTTLPAGDYELALNGDAAMDDTVAPNDPPEAGHMKAAVTGTFNLSFFPPTAGFRHSLEATTVRFDGSPSSAGDANRPIRRWRWTFGDGRTATTSGPTVAHRYPSSPARPPSYRATLQVVDSGGALSPPVAVTIAGTATRVTARTRNGHVAVSGKVAPNRPRQAIAVTLAHRQGRRFRPVTTKHLRLAGNSSFATSFTAPSSGGCEVIAVHPGDRAHLGSRATSRPFRC